MLSSPNLVQELRAGWRLALAVVAAQLVGALALLAIAWPASVALTPDAPAWVFRLWLGAAFATPIGFGLGIAFQRLSGHAAPRLLTMACAAAALVFPLVGFGLVSA